MVNINTFGLPKHLFDTDINELYIVKTRAHSNTSWFKVNRDRVYSILQVPGIYIVSSEDLTSLELGGYIYSKMKFDEIRCIDPRSEARKVLDLADLYMSYKESTLKPDSFGSWHCNRVMSNSYVLYDRQMEIARQYK